MKEISLQAILFDCDGTIVNSEPVHFKAFNETLKGFGVKITWKDWSQRFLGLGSRQIMTIIFQEHRIEESVELWVNKRREKFRYLMDTLGKSIEIPGFLEFYHQVRAKGIKMIVASSGDKINVETSISALGLKDELAFLGAQDVSWLKPDPEVFLKSACILRVHPENCLVIEDSPIGVTAAKAAGMVVIALKTTSSDVELENADLIVQDYHEIRLDQLEPLFFNMNRK